MGDWDVINDFAKLRSRKIRPIDLVPTSGGTLPAFVGQVVPVGSKVAVGSFLLVRPIQVLGSESEQASGSFSVEPGDSVPVFLIGPGTPSTGENLICRFVDHRWVAERQKVRTGSSTFGTIPNCSCNTIPATLSMISPDPNCNYRMFQSCTLQYGPTPPVFAPLNLGVNSFLSTQDFPDPVAGNARFYYYLTCQYNQISLTRVYQNSPFGSPYRDGVLYTWLVGNVGNSCSPFKLSKGQAFPGSDLGCSVTLG
ncbi:hypothetical protein P12x_001647 [Tundrisphaera lichenicola]|uniref:hypothetical protein n=1 Tax=Tundrisphaera lichenicola TaxID=2029860 RepID=UPI003EBE63E8